MSAALSLLLCGCGSRSLNLESDGAAAPVDGAIDTRVPLYENVDSREISLDSVTVDVSESSITPVVDATTSLNFCDTKQLSPEDASIACDAMLPGVDAEYDASNTNISGCAAGALSQSPATLVHAAPFAIAIGDLNGDGIADLAVANASRGTVSVHPGHGDATFGLGIDYEIPTGATLGMMPTIDRGGLAIGDLNSDGRLDLVEVNDKASVVSVLLARQDGTLAPKVDYTMSNLYTSIMIADINGDGALDLVVAGSQDVAALLGQGDGTFGAPVSYASGSAAVISDLNGDGILDIVVADEQSNTVSVLLGQGHGAFAAKADYVVGNGPRFLAVGDFQGDGVLDVAVANVSGATVGVLLGLGRGVLGEQVEYALGYPPLSLDQVAALGIADLNLDGRPDLVVAMKQSNAVRVFAGSGNGRFGAGMDYSVGLSPVAIAVGDLNTDGRADLAVVNHGSNIGRMDFTSPQSGVVSILLALPNGVTGTSPLAYSTGQCPIGVAMADWNGDGKTDLVASTCGGRIDLLQAQPDHSFIKTAEFASGNSSSASGQSASSILASDVNADGKPDLIVANIGLDMVSVLLAQTDGTFTTPVDYAVGRAQSLLSTLDWNGDGNPDIAIQGEASVNILLGSGGGRFQGNTLYSAQSSSESVAIGDLNGDGRADIAAVGGNGLTVLFAQADGTFQSPDKETFVETDQYRIPGYAHSVKIADMNGDGRNDLVVDYCIWAGQENGTLKAHCYYPQFDATVLEPEQNGRYEEAVSDLNGDGRLDLIVPVQPSSVVVMLGQVDGSLSELGTFETDVGPSWVTAGDLNGDGKPDLVVANSESVSILYGYGDGRFAPKVDYPTQYRSRGVVIRDLNADGRADLALADMSYIHILLAQADGTFAPGAEYMTGRETYSLAAGDINGDGWQDLVFADLESDTIDILFGAGDGTFPVRTSYATARSPTGLALGDLNGDGRIDIALVHRDSNLAQVLLAKKDETLAAVLAYPWSGRPMVGDVNGDGRPEIAFVQDQISSDVMIFQSPSAKSQLFTSQPGPGVAGDLNGDGRPDIVIVDPNHQVAVMLAQPDGGFAPKVNYEIGPNSVGIVLRDLNNDGALDLITASPTSNTVGVLIGRGDGTFAANREYTAGGSLSSFTVGDIDGNGRLDIVVTDSQENAVRVFLNACW
jgi:hypothetical protein